MKTVSIANEPLLQETARLISEGRTVTHIVRGNSMNPFIVDRRDKVVLAPFADEDLKRGAFVLSRDVDTEQIVLHRIMTRKGDKLVLMGDGNIRITELTHTGLVMGLVTEVQRKGKTYSCTGTVWKTYSSVWMTLLPLRRILLGVWRRM